MEFNKDGYRAEFHRIAMENGGSPPGEIQFYKITNSKVSDWRDKPWNQWNNWGDLREEFGYARGKLNEAFDKSNMLRMLAVLTDSLRRLPNQRDLRREEKKNPAFPTDSTIRKHLGEKDGVIRSLIEFCEAKEEYSRVLQICKSLASSEQASAEPEPIENDAAGGYVYLVKSEDCYHVGETKAPYHRVSTIIKSLAHGGELIHFFKTDDRRGIEKYWHKRWKSKQIERQNATKGEWFNLNLADVAAFKRRKKYM